MDLRYDVLDYTNVPREEFVRVAAGEIYEFWFKGIGEGEFVRWGLEKRLEGMVRELESLGGEDDDVRRLGFDCVVVGIEREAFLDAGGHDGVDL
ncbi:uncharacterized protein RCC_04283 [Ramularia collo-cygni]|uniref:Uncharacterized protein n=1 Tax=Ramularia collo-cygni TaxID=112498 RepID=A0A2D3UTS9_9PEZI|nr:uncharacterized protein RCC_04283 [Ramularia collo-cygni]CZT18438.1 uncharacterized protein RCC_04283 [Ramularia collo-cygni]